MGPYRIVFCDIDGTLLDSDHALRDNTARGVKHLYDLGVPFILVSARSPNGILPIQRQLGIAGPIVAYGGALVLDGEGRTVCNHFLSAPAMTETKALVGRLSPQTITTVYSYDTWIADDAAHPRIVRESGITGVKPTQGGVLEILGEDGEAHKMFCMGDPADIQAIEDALRKGYPQLSVCKSKATYLEVTHGNATKAGAVRLVCDMLGIPVEEAVAFGDNFNDIDMLETCGMGVAMGNAPDPVKAVADRVTLDNNSDGVVNAFAEIPFRPVTGSRP